jgi:hypothetical protein
MVTESRISSYLKKIDEVLSRTVMSGIADSSVSSAKRPLLLQGEALGKQTATNRRMVAQFIISRCNYWPQNEFEHFATVCAIAHFAGLRLFPGSAFRQWKYDPSQYGIETTQVAVNAVGPALLQCLKQLNDVPTLSKSGQIALVA